MQCRTCGFMLPAGTTFCTNCGAMIDNQANGESWPVGLSQANPIPASTPNQAPPMNPWSNQQRVPPTAYGSPYSSSQQYSFDAPPPPPPPQTYGTPYAKPPGYAQVRGSYAPEKPPTPPPTRKGPRVGLVAGLIVLILVIVGVGLVALRGTSRNSTSDTAKPTTTSSTAVASAPTSISGTPLDPGAAAIIYKAQTATSIDSNDFPTHVTHNFAVNQHVYVTFQLKTNGRSGYTEAKLYSGTSYMGNKILAIKANFDHGYFTTTPTQPGTGTMELYWCTRSDCSEARLATFVTFNVS